MSRPRQKKSGSRPRRKKSFVPRRDTAPAPPPQSSRLCRCDPRTDGFLDDGPDAPEGPFSVSSVWFQLYTVSRDGHEPFLSEDLGGELDTGCDSTLSSDELQLESERLWAEVDAEGRSVRERVLRRSQLPELFEDFAESLEPSLMRSLARPMLEVLVDYVDSILRPTPYVILAWVHADRFADALPRFAASLDTEARAAGFAAIAAFFRWHAEDGSLNPERAARLAVDFERVATSAAAGSQQQLSSTAPSTA